MSMRLGVDLGTTWTAAAVERDGRVDAVTLGTRTTAMPSVVAVDGDAVVAGERAERRLAADPTSGVRECKRRLGDTAPMVLGATPYGAEALLGHLLGHVLAVVAEREGHAPDEVVLTHPANWGDFKLDLLREAGRLAGRGDVALRSEPEAAALRYAALGRIAPGDVVAVYDFGGGTFDAAVVRAGTNGAEILGAAEGLERLGGVDIDQVVVAHVDAALDGRLRELDTGDPEVRRALAALRTSCTAAKEALSTDTEVTVAVTVPGLSTEVRITRPELEAALRPRIADTLAALDRTVAAAGVGMDDLAGVLLVGGSSRIPVVAEEVGRHTGRPTLLDADPKLVVALGATGGTIAMTATGAPEDGEKDAPAAAAPTKPGARIASSTAAAKQQKERGASTLTAAGVGVAATAAAAGAAYGATRLLDGDGDDAPPPEEPPPVEPADDSLDAFDDVTSFAGGGGGSGGGGGVRSVGAVRARVVDEPDAPAVRAPRPEPAVRPPAEPMAAVPDGAFDAARVQLRERLDAWEPPPGADPAEVAELRSELEGLLERYEPRAGQSLDDAIADLRQQFDDQVEDFTQDLKIDALVEDAKADDAPETPETSETPETPETPEAPGGLTDVFDEELPPASGAETSTEPEPDPRVTTTAEDLLADDLVGDTATEATATPADDAMPAPAYGDDGVVSVADPVPTEPAPEVDPTTASDETAIDTDAIDADDDTSSWAPDDDTDAIAGHGHADDMEDPIP